MVPTPWGTESGGTSVVLMAFGKNLDLRILHSFVRSQVGLNPIFQIRFF